MIVEVVTRLWVAELGTMLRLLTAVRNLSFLRRVQTPSGAHAVSCSMEATFCFTVV